MTYGMEELIPIVAELSGQYTGYESTSVTYEKAGQLMEAVIYCICEYERSEGDEGAAAYAGQSETGKGMLVIPEKISAKEAYRLGYQLVDAKVRAMKEMYHGLLTDFRTYGNIALKETVGAVPEFLKWYDIRYAPQDTILTLDYPLLRDVTQRTAGKRTPGEEADFRFSESRRAGGNLQTRYTGIDAVYEYVKCICIEQRFLNRFPEAYVIQVLEKYAGESAAGELSGDTLRYEEIFENLCGILLEDVICHLLLKKPLDGGRITEADRSRIQALLSVSSLEDTKMMVRRMVKDFIGKVYGNDGEIWKYLEGECDNIIVRMVHSNHF